MKRLFLTLVFAFAAAGSASGQDQRRVCCTPVRSSIITQTASPVPSGVTTTEHKVQKLVDLVDKMDQRIDGIDERVNRLTTVVSKMDEVGEQRYAELYQRMTATEGRLAAMEGKYSPGAVTYRRPAAPAYRDVPPIPPPPVPPPGDDSRFERTVIPVRRETPTRNDPIPQKDSGPVGSVVASQEVVGNKELFELFIGGDGKVQLNDICEVYRRSHDGSLHLVGHLTIAMPNIVGRTRGWAKGNPRTFQPGDLIFAGRQPTPAEVRQMAMR